MELSTFGAVLRFALDLESQLAQFYTKAAGTATRESLRADLADLAAAGERSGRRLEQVRRQQVNEMLLEPIHGIDASAYRVEPALPTDDATLLAAALHNERVAERFYQDMASLLSIPEVVRSLSRMADAHAQNRQRLSSLGVIHHAQGA